MADEASVELVARWRAGDQQAAEELFRRFAERLMALARSRLSARLARHVDPEDVVQSVYRSFFADARAGRFVLQQRGDLWRLLTAITIHKVLRQAERYAAGKRAVGREQTPADDSSLFGLDAEVVSRAPSPSEAAAAVDELELLMRRLTPMHRQMVEVRLQGYRIEEIAAATRRSERLVRRVLQEKVKAHLEERLRLHAGS